jgi:hypothetical protein
MQAAAFACRAACLDPGLHPGTMLCFALPAPAASRITSCSFHTPQHCTRPLTRAPLPAQLEHHTAQLRNAVLKPIRKARGVLLDGAPIDEEEEEAMLEARQRGEEFEEVGGGGLPSCGPPVAYPGHWPGAVWRGTLEPDGRTAAPAG